MKLPTPIKSALRFFGMYAGDSGIAYTGDGGRMVRTLGTTSAGPTINEQTCLTIPALYHGIRTYAQTIGSLDWNLVQIEPRGKSVARGHPVHRLLHDNPNEFQLASEFRETLIAHALIYGNGFAYIEKNGNQRPTALMPLLPWNTYPIRVGGQVKYITYINGSQITLEPDEVFHLKGLSMDGLGGMKLVRLMSESLGLTKAEEQFAALFFGAGANYGGVVEIQGTLGDQAMKNLRDSFQDNHGGLGNAFRWQFLEEGMKATPNQIDGEKTQMIQSRTFQISEIARVIGLPPHLLYDLSRSTNNNIEWQGIEAVTYAFRPWATKLCQEASRKLLYESEQDAFEPTIDLKPLMMGDSKTQAETAQIGFNTLAWTPNEIRAKNGANPIEGGDQLFVNQAYMPLDVAIQRALAAIGLQNAQAAAVTPPDPGIAAQIAAAAAEGIDTQPPEPSTEPTPQGGTTYYEGPKVDPKEVQDIGAMGGSVPALEAARSMPADTLRPVIAATVERLITREKKAVRAAVKKDGQDLARWGADYGAKTRTFAFDTLTPLADTLKSFGHTRDIAAIADGFAARTLADVKTLADSTDRTADMDLMLEGWTTERAESLVNALIGE